MVGVVHKGDGERIAIDVRIVREHGNGDCPALPGSGRVIDGVRSVVDRCDGDRHRRRRALRPLEVERCIGKGVSPEKVVSWPIPHEIRSASPTVDVDGTVRGLRHPPDIEHAASVHGPPGQGSSCESLASTSTSTSLSSSVVAASGWEFTSAEALEDQAPLATPKASKITRSRPVRSVVESAALSVGPSVLDTRGAETRARDAQVLTGNPFIGPSFAVGRLALSECRRIRCFLFGSCGSSLTRTSTPPRRSTQPSRVTAPSRRGIMSQAVPNPLPGYGT